MDEGDGHEDARTAGPERCGDLLDHLREGFQVIDFDWRYVYVNEAACRHGRRSREELLGRRMTEPYPGIEDTAMFDMLQRCMEERTADRMENEFTFPDGSKQWFELRVEPVPEGIAVLSLDIDRRKRLEAQLRQSQKMEAVGRLAGGIAHDFNNILTAIQSFGEFALAELAEEHPSRRDLGEVLAAADRAEKLVGQLLAFSRRQPVKPRVLDVNDLVLDLDDMLRRVLGEDVDLITRPQEHLWSVRIDPSAFEQVLVNLAVNARDAMPGGGKLTIETGNVELDESYSMTRGGTVVPGEYVVLAVTDNGEGMDAATRARLFEPFFTTKSRERGTGLGLSTCFGIVRQAGGYIWVYSEPGEGSTFKIYLPRAAGEPEGPRAEAKPLVAGGSETVLVVEDNPQVRRLAARTLRLHGYRVLEAGRGEEALRIGEEEEGPIHLLLTDVVMPEMGGKVVADRLERARPETRVLFMTGYTENAIVHHGALEPGVELVQKPFTPDRLARKVRAVLDA